ncbi:helix-turn-helix transcriptional regulator [Jeotgalibacillus haloalkalitolerans]|uniref:Helix-turn-helix transcriptional regulator n=1 Tax=Jeotgalibacillus haloalkalitolerans TaxID=3104292 RepID=A0ABU5KM13_9BACL|nr:helix-turn-helix transcriptional regulator [Jeotgalibacillus sp. HH7-29]MDZ5712278.1 helix-turn-helix transcriptional regulator [Jeotgalibacillus sp. HH7-29]
MTEKEMTEILSENLKKLLREYNMTQSQLSKIAGVSESTVGKWVLKKSFPRMGVIQKIADHFNLPKSYLLEEDQQSNSRKAKLQTIAAHIDEDVTDEELEDIMEYIEFIKNKRK